MLDKILNLQLNKLMSQKATLIERQTNKISKTKVNLLEKLKDISFYMGVHVDRSYRKLGYLKHNLNTKELAMDICSL